MSTKPNPQANDAKPDEAAKPKPAKAEPPKALTDEDLVRVTGGASIYGRGITNGL